MPTIHSQLEDLLSQVETNNLKLKVIQNGDLSHVKELDLLFDGFIVLSNLKTYAPVYFNDKALDFLGYKNIDLTQLSSFEFYRKILHPSNLDIIPKSANFFLAHPEEIFSSVVRVKKHNNTWHDIFFSAKAVEFSFIGEASLTLIYCIDIADYFQSRESIKDLKSIYHLKNDKIELTEREKEVIQKIAQEKTTFEIADELNLSTHTIDTYRKRLLKKLKVKSSVGLAIYAIKNNLL